MLKSRIRETVCRNLDDQQGELPGRGGDPIWSNRRVFPSPASNRGPCCCSERPAGRAAPVPGTLDLPRQREEPVRTGRPGHSTSLTSAQGQTSLGKVSVRRCLHTVTRELLRQTADGSGRSWVSVGRRWTPTWRAHTPQSQSTRCGALGVGPCWRGPACPPPGRRILRPRANRGDARGPGGCPFGPFPGVRCKTLPGVRPARGRRPRRGTMLSVCRSVLSPLRARSVTAGLRPRGASSLRVVVEGRPPETEVARHPSGSVWCQTLRPHPAGLPRTCYVPAP